MIVQSIQCDNCGKIMKNESEDYFLITGGIYKGTKYALDAPSENSHICVNCFIKHFNLMVSTPREPLGIEKQGDILKRKIEGYQPLYPTKNDPYPHNGRFN